MRTHALWVGRFQPPTNAHLFTLEKILENWSKVTVGIVIKSNFDPISDAWAQFIASTSTSTMASWKNPFSGDEVKEMWQASVSQMILSNVVEFVIMPQIGQQHDFNKRFPEHEYDFVEVEYTNQISQADRLRKNTFESLLKRKVFYVNPSFVLHNTEIRKLISEGKSWAEFLPHGTFEVFRRIGGPERIQKG